MQSTSGNVTKQEIYKAANEIAACGEMPSIKMVRTFLGDRGSETTLQKHLKDWKLELLQRGTNSDSAGCVFCAESERLLKQYQATIDELKADLTDAIESL